MKWIKIIDCASFLKYSWLKISYLHKSYQSEVIAVSVVYCNIFSNEISSDITYEYAFLFYHIYIR